MLLTYLHTAGRMREVFNLAWKDVDFDGQRLRLWTNKRKGGKESDWIPMTTVLAQAMRIQRFKTGLMTHVFINTKTGKAYSWRSKLMSSLCQKSGVECFGFHSIRHLPASILDKAGVPLAAIQAILRHKSSHTTARYIHSLVGTKIELDRAFDHLGSRAVTG